MAAVIEIQVKADIQQAAIGLRALLADLTKTGTISTSTASTVQSSLNKMTNAVEGFGNTDFSGAFVNSLGNISTGLRESNKAVAEASLTWKEFVGQRMGAYMKEFGGHGPAIKKIAEEWQVYKNNLSVASGETITATSAIKGLNAAIKNTNASGLEASLQKISNLDFSSQFVASQQKVSDSIDKMAAKALGMETIFETFGTKVNLSSLTAAFNNTDKSVEGLEAQIFSLRDAIELTTDPVILQRFGQQLNALTSQLANTRIVGAVKVEKITIPKLDVPLVAPKIDLSALQALQATFNSTIAPVDQLEAKIKGLEVAITKATNPAQPAMFRAEIDKLKTQLSGLKFDKINIDPTSLRVLQGAFIDANKPLTQLEAEIQVLEAALKSATANGSKDVGRLSEQLGVLKAKFTTLTDTSLASAFTDATKSVTQLENEIFSLGEKIQVSANPEEIIQFTAQINNLQKQLNNLKFGGIDLKINSSGLTALQTAFIDAIKPAQQLENEIEALEQALKINADPTALKVYGAQVLKLKQQLSEVGATNLEKTIQRAGQAASKSSSAFRPFTKGSNEASLALLNLGRVAQDAPFGFLGIANNLNPLLESFQRLGKDAGGLKNSLKALAGSVMGAGGIGLALSAFQFIALGGVDAVAKMFSGVDKAKAKADKLREAANAAKQAAQDFVDGLNDITQARLKGTQSAQEELTKLSLLYDASQNQNISLANRKKIVDELQAQYPKYFKNLSDETILAGGAKDAYLKLADAILATSRAQAEREKLVDIQKQILTSEEQTTDALRNQLFAVQAINKAKASGRKETIISATGEERMTSFGADMVQLEKNLKDATENVNKSYKEKVSLLQRATNLSKDLNQVVEKDPTVLLGDPAGKLKEAANKDNTKFNFFDKFFDLTPPTGQVEKQITDMFETAREFAQKNVNLFQVKVGDKFIDLSELQQVGKRKEVVELGKKVWASIQQGLVKFKPPKIELPIEIQLVPTDTSLTPEQVQSLVDRFTDSLKGLNEKINIEPNINIDEVSKADEVIKAFQQRIDSFAKDASQLGSRLGEPIRKAFQGIISNSLSTELNNGIKANMSEDEIKKLQDRLKGLGENLAIGLGLLSGVLGNLQGGFETFFETIISGGGNAFQKLGQAIAGMITKLIASLAAMAAISGLLSLIIPGAGSFANVFKGLVGSSLGIKGFASGGLVFGPTMGMVGEGRGTSRSNPEVIAPLDKLKNFLSPSGGLQHVVVTGRLSGNDILISNQRQANKNRRNG
jgi:hypothetical protein